jgi:hypothetical protein
LTLNILDGVVLLTPITVKSFAPLDKQIAKQDVPEHEKAVPVM